MAVKPASGEVLIIEGQFDFTAQSETFNQITDKYQLHILIPSHFPRELPVVHETLGRIPRDGSYHVNPDGSLCLGSRLRLLWKLAKTPTLEGFAENCLVPYLFAISHKLSYGGNLPFGELAHGSPGELMDYVDLFGLQNPKQARIALQALGMKKRRANKCPCPCECGHRLGRCQLHLKLNEFRRLAERRWFRLVWSSQK